MEYIITIGLLTTSCSCDNFKVDMVKTKNPELKRKIQKHADVHAAEPEATVIVRNMWET